jgi:O-antigen ligase
MIIRRGPSGIVNLTRAGPGVISSQSLPTIVRWSFLLFIASIGCEVSSLTQLSGLLFFAIYFLYHNPLARKRSFPPAPRVIIWFVIYIAVYALSGLFLSPEQLSEFFARLFTLVQSIGFLWIASDILKDENLAKKALFGYAIATLVLALGMVLSLPGFDVTGDVGSERASVGPMNANVLAYATALGVVALLGLWLNLSHKRLVESVWIFGSMLVLSLATVYTGSRGAVVMLMVGLSVYLVPYWKNRWRMSTSIVALIAMAGLVYIAATTPVFYERWLDYSEEGDTSGRDKIFANGLDMISERPLVGWGPVEFRYELGSRTHARAARDAHNIFLHLFMEVGIVGAVPFLIGLWLCGKGAWEARNRTLGLLPLALLVASLVGGMSGNNIYFKSLWFVLAVIVGARGEGKRMILAGRPVETACKGLL